MIPDSVPLLCQPEVSDGEQLDGIDFVGDLTGHAELIAKNIVIPQLVTAISDEDIGLLSESQNTQAAALLGP